MTRFLSAFFLFAIATTASAAVPGGVRNLQASAEQNGTVKIVWDAAEGADIAYYRVYYAVESILESGGAYDDYDETEGAETEYIFEEEIPEEGLYLAVMAVNMDGEESEYFMEEVQILPVANPDEEEPASPEPLPEPTPEPTPAAPAEENGSLALLSAESTANDTVELTFSAPVQVRPKSAATAFRITKAGGEALAVKALQGEGLTLTLTTDPQQGVVYQVQLTDALSEELGVTFDEASRSAFFTGTGDAPAANVSSASSAPASVASSVSSQTSTAPLPPAPEPQAPQAPQGMQNISGMRLRVTAANPNGTFNVTGEWDLQSVSQQAAFLLVGQSFDAGKTFVSPAMVPANATQVNIQGVPAGHFGLLVQVVDAQGNMSSGVFETAWLGKGMPTSGPIPAQPTAPTSPTHTPPPPPVVAQLPVGVQPTSGLPQSGAGFLAGSLAFAGMAVGWQRMRKRAAA